MSEQAYDLIVIGAGPGGYVGAIRAAQLGLRTAIVEKDKTLGGTCLNVGCIPSKALLDSSEHFEMAKHGKFAEHGVKLANVELDLPAMLSRKDKVVKDLTNGVAFLMKKHKVDVHYGTGKFAGPGKVEVTGADGVKTLSAKNVMIATGSVPVALPTLLADGKRIITSTEALSLKEVPKHLIVVGGGVIGLELGSVWLRLGAKVTVVEFAERIGGGMDRQVSQNLQRILEKQGFRFLLNTKVTGARVSANSVNVTMEGRDGAAMESQEGDVVLVAVGRKPFTEGLGLENLGIQRDQGGRVVVDGHYRTSAPGVYAVGDVIHGPMLAHKAEEEGVAVAEIIAGKAGHVNYNTVPGVVYTWPEVAWVGVSEEQAKQQGIEYNVGTFPFMANGRAKAMASTDGLVKVIADKKTDRVIGVHIIGPRASDIISEAVVAMEFGASSEDIARSFHAHPTLPEAIREAALAVDKRARQS